MIDLNQTARDFNQAPGTLFSRPLTVEQRGDRGGTFALVADQRSRRARPPTPSG